MGFHRYAVPSYTGGLPAGYDYINNAASGTPASADSALASGTYAGSYFFGGSEQVTSAGLNRAAKALAQNCDALDDLFRRDIAIPVRTAVTTAPVGGVSSITLTGPGIFVGASGTANSTAGIRTFVRVVDQDDVEVFSSGTECVPSSITGATPGDGFSTGNVTLNLAATIPAGISYRVYYYVRDALATFNEYTFAQWARPNVAPTYTGVGGAGYSLTAGTVQYQLTRIMDMLAGVDNVRAVSSSTTLDSPLSGVRDGTLLFSVSSSFTVTLPSPFISKGRKWLLLNPDASMSGLKTVTLARHSTEKINNSAANYVLSMASGKWLLFCDGTDWTVCAMM